MRKRPVSRRDFIKGGVVAGAALGFPTIVPGTVFSATAPGNRVNVGLIGCGNIAADLCIALQKDDIPAKIAALTDTVEEQAKRLVRVFQLEAQIGTLEETAAGLAEIGVGSVIFDPCGNRPAEGDYLEVMAANAVRLEDLAR